MTLLGTILGSLPALLEFIKSERAKTNPGEPPPTDAEVIAALNAVVLSVVQKGEAWKAQHPPAEG